MATHKKKTAGHTPVFRWSHPYEWLTDHHLTKDHDREELANLCRLLAEKLDGDQLQDLFQDEMETDGYFDDLNAPKTCPDCGTELTPPEESTEAGALPPNYCTECDREVEIDDSDQ